MMSLSLRRIALLVLILIFVGLIFSVYSQYRIAWRNLDSNLEESLALEGVALAEWISKSLYSSLVFDAWSDSPDPELFDLTGSRWALVNQAGELIEDASGNPFYEYPEGAFAEILALEPLPGDRLEEVAQQNGIVAGPLFQSEDRFGKRLYFPVRVPTEIFGENWVLVGQAGEGYFAELFDQQTRFWWTASTLSFASAIFVLLLIRGIARTEQLERTLRDAEERIQLESLSSTLAHELRNPLSIIQSAAEILRRDEPLTPDGDLLAADIIEEVQRSQDVLSRHLHPERRAPEEIADLGTFLRDYWKRRAALAEAKRLEVEIRQPEEADSIGVCAIPDQLEQILDNLLRNASEAMPDGGRIKSELALNPESATLILTDNGPGLGLAGAVWKDGWRMGSSKGDGLGIGLRLANRWVRGWGGSLEARTLRAGWFGKPKGTEVRITLKRV